MNTLAYKQKVTDHSQNITKNTEVNQPVKLKQKTLDWTLPSTNASSDEFQPGYKEKFGFVKESRTYKHFGEQPAPPKEDHYATKMANGVKQGKHTKKRKYLAKELRFTPSLDFKDPTANHDKKTIKLLDKTIRGLAIDDVLKACKFTKQAGEKDWRDDADLPHMFAGQVPREFYHLMGDFYLGAGSEVAHACADYLEGPLHFWLTTVMKFASMPKVYYPYIINDIVSRYACLLRTQDMGLISGYGALMAVGASLNVAFEGGKHHLRECNVNKACTAEYRSMCQKLDGMSDSGPVLEHVCSQTGEKQVWKLQAGDEEASFDLFGMLKRLDKVLSGANTKSIIADIIKAVSVGALATTAMTSGKFSTFSIEGANALVAYTMRKYTDSDSVYAGLFRAATCIYSLVYNWFTCPTACTFVEFVNSITKVDAMYELLRELAAEESVWASLDAKRKNAWVNRFEQLRDFAKLTLGADKGWRDAKRYLQPKQVDEFRLKFIVLEARHMSDVVNGLRPVPFSLVISGATAQGKTGFTHDLNEFFMQKVNVPKELMGRLIYTLQDNPSDFWDGYQSGTLGIVLDDVCALRSSLSEASGGDKMRRIVGQLLNNQTMLVNKAELSQKENTSARPMWVLANTNLPTLEPGELYRFACIFDRRWNWKIHIQLKKEFATDGGTLCHKAAAADYARRLAANDNSPDDFWEYWVYEASTVNGYKEGINFENQMPEFEMKTVLRRSHVFTCSALFYDWLGKEFDKHHVYQEQLVDKMDRPKVFGTQFAPNPAAPEFVPSPPHVPADQDILPWDDAADIVRDDQASTNLLPDKIKLEAWQDAVKPAVCLAAAMASLYYGKKTIDYVVDKKNRLEKLLEDAEHTSRVVASSMPIVDRAINATQSGLEIADNASVATQKTLVYLKQALSYLAAISAVIGVTTLLCKGFSYFSEHDIVEATIVGGYKQGNSFTVPAKGSPVHPNDTAAKYEPPLPLGNTNYLTQQSKASQGPNLFNKVWTATRHFKFVSEKPNADGDLLVITAQGTFVKDKWFIINHHCVPGVVKKNAQAWGNWLLHIQSAGTNMADVIMDKKEFMANTQFYHDTRDMVAVYVPRARDYADITKYMADIPGDMTTDYIPAGLRIFPIGLHARIDNGDYYGTAPIDHGWGPTGYLTKPYVMMTDADGSNHTAVAAVNFVSKVGDCGRPYVALKGEIGSETPYLIYGMHMGVNDDDPIQKLIVPWRKQDFDCLTIPMQLFVEVPDKHCVKPLDFTLQLAEADFVMPVDVDKAAIWKMIHRCPPMLAKHHMKDETKDWIAGVVSELNGGIFVPTGSARFVGQRVRIKSAKFKSKIRRAPLASILFKKNFSATPFKTFGSGKVIPELTTKQVGVGVAVACAKAYSQPKNQPWSNQLRADARMAVEAMLLDVDEDMALRPDEHVLKQLHKITPQEALNGIVDEESGAKLKAGESVNKQTSAGLYWNEKPSPNGAKGKLGYIIRLPGEPDRLHDDMQLALDELRALMEKGDYKCMVEAVIKDEPMKPSKLAEGRIRFILVMSMECTLLTREYLFTICRIMSLNPFFFGAMVGIDSSSIQWEQLHNFLRAGEADLFDGDFQGFEYTLYDELSESIKYYYEQLCVKSGNYTTSDLNTTHNILANLTHCIVDFFGNVHEFDSVNSSGNPLTTQINCTLVKTWVYIVILNRLKELLGDSFTFEIFREVVKNIIRIASYGDDLLAGVVPDKKHNIKILDQIIMQEKLAKYGVVFTDAAKNMVLTEPFPKHYTFLGRSFSEDHKGRCVAKLEEVRIMKPLEFYTEHDQLTYAQLLKSTMRSVLQETYYYGREAYDDLKAILVESVAELFEMSESVTIDTFFSAGIIAEPVELTYDFFEDWFSAKYYKGAIVDTRLDEVLNQSDGAAQAVYDKIAALMRGKSCQ